MAGYVSLKKGLRINRRKEYREFLFEREVQRAEFLRKYKGLAGNDPFKCLFF